MEKTGVLKVVGSLSLYMMRLGEEYTKSLQSINPHTQEYIRRLKDESVVVELAAKVQAYYERQGEMSTAADLALLQVRAEACVPWGGGFSMRVTVCVVCVSVCARVSVRVASLLPCWFSVVSS